jgi:hypothetical protein
MTVRPSQLPLIGLISMPYVSSWQPFHSILHWLIAHQAGSYRFYECSADPSLPTPGFSISGDTPSTRMEQSPILPGQPNSAGSHWIETGEEYFPTYVQASHPRSAAFTYGNWEEYMRWDGVAEPASPSRLDISPPAYRRNKGVSSAQHESMMSPRITGPETCLPENQASLDQVSMSAMDLGPYTFGYNHSGQADFPFGDAMDSAPDQSSPQEYNFGPEVVNWDTPPQISPMTLEEHQRLRNLAFQRTSSYGSHQSCESAGDVRTASASPEPARTNSIGKKRKSPDPPVKKTAHNMIEKRYRTNLNDKISALRDSVPSLRAMPKSAPGTMEGDEDRETLEGLVPAHKMNKATILSKSVEYIHHLERRNRSLEDENASLRARIRAIEKVTIAGSMGTSVTAGGISIAPRIQGPPPVAGENEDALCNARPTSRCRPNWLSQLPARPITGD